MAGEAPWSADVNLADYLVHRHVRSGEGERTALLYEEARFSYAELANHITRVAGVLTRRGVQHGDRILLLLPDSPAYPVAFFAGLQIGAVVVPLNPALAADDVGEIAARVDARFAFVDAALMDKFAPLRSSVRDVVSTGDFHGRPSELESAAADVPAETAVHRENDALAYILFSSGTTGLPKGIPHRHADILYCIEAYSLPVLGMSRDDRVLAVPKLTFGYGLGGNLLSALYVGASAVLLRDPASGQSIAEAAARYRPSLFLAQPRIISQLVARAARVGFEGLRLAVSAGEVLAPALYDKWRKAFDVELLDGFGSTEIGHVFISNAVGAVRPGCAGQTLAGFEVKIVDDGGAPVAVNQVGHLWVRGPTLATGYWKDQVRTQQHFRDGWVRTGDLFYSDDAGYLYVAGRADEMIKAGCGQWIAPTELESVLHEDEAVAESAVVGYSDSDGVVRPKAFVVLRAGLRPTPAIEQRLSASIAARWPEMPHKHLAAVEFISALPRTTTGKIQRFKLLPASLTEFSYDC
jgi:benzoate-CoA ligase family protein